MQTLLHSSELAKLHETDPTLWLEKTIECLKSDRLDQLDIEHLIEELEDLNKRNKNKVASGLSSQKLCVLGL